MNLNNFENQIRKTGFDLEYRISRALDAAAWNVINNKYYVDDHEESIREIDLVAYKVEKVRHLTLYTTLIISCKKNDSWIWGLLAKDGNPKAVNIDRWPLHIWTNDKALDFQFRQKNANKKYHEDVQHAGVVEAMRSPAADIFAFQEMNRETGSPQNDKSIFAAITSLMKAQAYELTALPTRKKDPAIYQFNLMSVVDTDLVRLHFSDTGVNATSVDTDHYIARYIIQKKETFARIHFVKAEKFGHVLSDYGRLHEANCQLASSMCDAFYLDVFADWRRTQVFLEDFRKAVGWVLKWRVGAGLKRELDFSNLSFNDYKIPTDKLSIAVPDADDELLVFLNNDNTVHTEISRKLKDIYRYDGNFKFDVPDIPF